MMTEAPTTEVPVVMLSSDLLENYRDQVANLRRLLKLDTTPTDNTAGKQINRARRKLARAEECLHEAFMIRGMFED